MKPFSKIENVRDIRKKLGMNQSEFWNQIGVTQSGGSRYESGRNIPRQAQELLRLVYVEQVQLHKINRKDLLIAGKLKAMYPAIYKEISEMKKKD